MISPLYHCIIKIDILENQKNQKREREKKNSEMTFTYIKINECAEFLISSLSLLFACLGQIFVIRTN